MNVPLPRREGSKKKPYVKPAFEIHHRPAPPHLENQTIPQRLRATIGRFLARFRNDPQERMRNFALATEIIEFGRMRSNDRNHILIEVPLVAYHMRETPHHIRRSLRLLEMKGIAKRTKSKDHWELIA